MSLVVPSLRGIVASAPWAKNELWRKAQAAPSLDLRFADSKSLTDAVSGQNLITFTRSGNATYFDADGVMQTAGTNTARFDHDPETGESLGLLIEEQRTNYHLYSESAEEASAFSGKINCTVSPNAVISPDGLTTGDAIVVTSTASSDIRVTRLAPTGATTNTLSVFAKAGTNSYCALILRDKDNAANSVALECDIANGTVSIPASNTGSATGATGDIVPYGNGWYRIYISGLVGGTGGVTYIVTQRTVSGSNSAVAGSTIHLWGAQMEVGAFPTSYIPTTSATVTRNADVASITGSNFSSWYRQDEGSIFAETRVQSFTVSNFARLASIDRGDGSSNFIAQVRSVNSTRYEYSVFAPTGQAVGLQPPVTLSSGSNVKTCCVYAANDFINSANGVLSIADTSGTVPSLLTTLGIGMTGNASLQYNGHIRRLAYFDRRLPNATLQAITSP